MSLIWIILVLIVVGVLLWLANAYIPMAAPIKTILNIVVVIAVILWLLSVFGIFSFGAKNTHVYNYYNTNNKSFVM
jgi:hypothetical protein